MSCRPKIGVSACLLGERVRYDGGHKLDRWLTGTVGPHVEYVPICPEVGAGLPVPRETMLLEGEPEAPRLVTTESRVDQTERMLAFCRARVVELEDEGLCCSGRRRWGRGNGWPGGVVDLWQVMV